MRSRKLLSAILAAGAALSVAPVLGGCTAGATYVVETEEPPPPPRYERFEYRPGFVWIEGRWIRTGRHWRWESGYYERERPSMVYIRGRWENRGGRYVWVDGGWRPRASASITVHGRVY
jgi:hypothetical protein